MGKRYHNYHKHTTYSNPHSLDSVTKPIEYIERAIELDGKNAIYFTTEHGYQGNVFEANTLCEEKEIKLIVGSEVYYVENRFEKDKSNYHLVLIAKNMNGYKQLNKALSKANIDGFYYKPRIDDEILFNLNPNDFVVTTACVAGRLRNNNGLDKWIIKMKNYFGDNFYLEVQNHNEEIQKKHNEKILELSKKYNIKIIHANDSHYIYPKDAIYRDLFLKAKGITYEDESNFILDYPSYDEVVERYKKQGVLSDEEIELALDNTLIFDDFEGVKLDYDLKMPHVSDNPNRELKEIINKEWLKESKSIPIEEHEKYLDAIKYEISIVENCHMEEYFILDYKIVDRAIKVYNGMLTKTGRGSAVSFYINKLLRLTEIDRLKSPITLYPTRFMSTERILKTRSLPDIDLNSPSRDEFIQATKDLLGEENCGWMLVFKPLQDSSAFRLYCKALGMKNEEYNEIAKNLDDYREDEKWKQIIEESKHFIGAIESISPSPCSMLLYDHPLDEEIGFIKMKEGICVNIDGYNCDKYKYLKNDYLQVTVYEIIRDTCKLAEIKIPTIEELENLLDKKTFDIYTNKLTCSINQADSDFATELVSRYTPKNVAEVSAFVASIRPGFASLLDNFIERKPYTTGVNELDAILEDSYHYLMYQESIMKYLIWLGIEESESYDIIKKIAKKKFKEEELKELKKKLEKGWIKQVGTIEGFNETWQVVEDASRYSFNASHSLSYAYDSLYGAYLKAHYPLEYYAVALRIYREDIERTSRLTDELSYFNIELKSPKFRYSKAEYFMDKETNSIYKGISSIKFLNETVGNELYSLRDNKYDTFLDLLIDLENIKIDSRQLDILIRLNFFSEFGTRKYLLDIVKLFNKWYNKKQFRKIDLPMKEELFRQFAESETEKMFTKVDTYSLCVFLMNILNKDDELSIAEIIKNETEYIGSATYSDENEDPTLCVVLETNTKYTPKITVYNIYSGKQVDIKISKKLYKKDPIKKGDLVHLLNMYQKHKTRMDENGEWVEIEDKFDIWCDNYEKVLNN